MFAFLAIMFCFVSSAFAQKNVAKIGDTEYATFQAALKACVAGDNTITLLDDCGEAFTFAQTKGVNITVDGDGKTFSGKITLDAGGGNLTFTDAVIAPANSQSIYVSKSTAPNLVFDGCKLQGQNSSGTIVYCYSSSTSNSVTVKDCIADNLTYIVSCRQTGAKSVKVENVTATNMLYLVRTLKCPSVTIKNVTCDAVTAVEIKNDAANGKLTLENVNFNVRKYNGEYQSIISGIGAAKSWTVNVKGTCMFTNDGEFCDEWFVGNDGYELVIDENAVINHKEPSGKVAYRADVTDKEDREGIAVLLKDVYAQESVVVKVYHDETLMFTCERREIDDEGKVMFPVDGNTTANIVLWGKESGSWINDILVEPTVENVPNKIEVYSDGVLVDTYTNNTGTVLGDQLNKYLALDCVKEPVAKIGDKTYMTLAAAVAAAPAGATVTLVADAVEAKTVVLTKDLTIDGAGKTFTGAIEFKKQNGYFTIKNVKFNGDGTRVYALKSQSNTTNLTVEGCTATDYTYGFLYANSAIANVTVKDVTVKYVTYGVHSARGTNVTLDNFVAENVKYGVMVQNYTGRNVVLNNCSFTDSENPLYVWKRDGYENKITFNFKGVNEMGKADFCTRDYAVVNADAVVGTKVCAKLADAVEAAEAGETVALLRNVQPESYVTIDKSITLDLGEYNITREGTALYVNGDVEVAIEGDGTVTGKQALYVANGLVKVNSGNFHGIAEAVYVQNTGKVEIWGGTFSSNETSGFVLNEYDATRDATDITVYAGTFVGFNPADNAAEGAGTNFVADSSVSQDNGDGTYTVKCDPAYGKVAKIGDVYYEDLAEAFAAAQSGETVTLISDITLTNENAKRLSDVNGAEVMVTVRGNVILDMNGKKITVSEYVNTTGGKNPFLLGVFYIVDGAGLTVTGNGTIDIPQTDNQVGYVFWKRGTTGHLVIKNGTFHAGNLEDSMVYTNGNDIVTVEGGTFTLDGVGSHGNGFPVIFNASGNDVRHINVTGGTYNTNITDQKWKKEVKLGEGCEIVDNGDGTWSVIKVGAYVAESAEGTKVPYSSLAEAVAAAQDGNIVTLAADAVDEGIVINKSITIDFNGKTYSFTEGVGSTGTESNGFQIKAGSTTSPISAVNNVVLKNGTLNVAEEAADKFYILVQNYANLTVENMDLDGTNLDKYAFTDGDSYVLSNNCGEVVVKGNTNITANNHGDKAFAFDACRNQSYVAPVVKVYTTGYINGNIENSATIELYGGTYSYDVTEYCALRHAVVKNQNSTYTVEALDVEEMTIVQSDYDGGVYENQNAKEVAKLTYIRTLFDGKGSWVSFYVPFAVPVSAFGSDYEVAYLNNVLSYDKKDAYGNAGQDGVIDDLRMEYITIKSGTLYANTPYVIKPLTDAAADQLTLVLTGVTLESTKTGKVIEMASSCANFKVAGTYETIMGDKLLEGCTENSTVHQLYKNNWSHDGYGGTYTTFWPFEAYMIVSPKEGTPFKVDPAAFKSIGGYVAGEEYDGTTYIYDVVVENGEEVIYDLQGRRVNAAEKGIYIKGGNKVLVR